MRLPQSFGLFVKATGARPYQDPANPEIAGLSMSSAFSTSFGLAGILNRDTTELHITIGQRTVPGSLDFTTVTGGVLGLYRTATTGADSLLQEVDLTVDLLKRPRNSPAYWEVVVKTNVEPSVLKLACTLTDTNNTSYSTWIYEADEKRSREVRYYKEPERVSVDVRYEDQPQTVQLVESGDANPVFYSLDFTTANDPDLLDSGVLTYSGGGNRYLVNADGESELQTTNQAPWLIPANTFTETAATNYFTDSPLVQSTWKLNPSVSMVTVPAVVAWSGYPGYNLIEFAVSSPVQMDSVWEWASEIATTTNQTLTGSLFWSYANQSNRMFPLVIGLRIWSGSTLLRTVTRELGSEQIPDLTLLQITDTVADTSSDPRSVQLFVQVQRLCPGDRFVAELAAPQLENGVTASSRIVSGLSREADQITYQPTAPAYDVLFGRFNCIVFPAYSGTPGPLLGDQTLFDTRDGSGEAGFWAMHRADGVMVFGLAGESSAVQWICESASVMQITDGAKLVLDFCFDVNVFVIRLNGVVIGTKNIVTNPLPVPDQTTVRIGRNYTNTNYFNGEFSAFSLHTDELIESP